MAKKNKPIVHTTKNYVDEETYNSWPENMRESCKFAYNDLVEAIRPLFPHINFDNWEIKNESK